MNRTELKRIKKKMGERIRARRRENGLSGVELARASGLRYGYLMNIERGNHDVRLENLRRIARALGVTLTELLDGVM